jgi:cytochrome c6
MKTNLSSKIAIVALLLTCLVGWSARAEDAGSIWATKCASCHGKDGKGGTMMGRKLAIKDLTDPKVQASFTDADATKTIKEGDSTKKMKGFADKLSDADVTALVAHIRSLK